MASFNEAQQELKPFGKNWPTLSVLLRPYRKRRGVFHRQNIFGDNASADLSFYMGDAHAKGRVSPSDPKQAHRWWREAAERGHVQAMIALGASLIIGYGAPKDIDQARYWLKRAGREGDKKARHMLALAYVATRRKMRELE